VSHGPDRDYDRYIPHLGFVYRSGAFRRGKKGSSPSDIADYMGATPARHPVRRSLSTLLKRSELDSLVLNLPPCSACNTPRIQESQRFCHICGSQLVSASLFNQCMEIPLAEIPGISAAMVARIKESGVNAATIGQLLAAQNPSAVLQEARFIGLVRATKILQSVGLIVDEFLS
jgi:hypothetical protein